jgi:heme ABC exporter ATP-binding subunit CcmA
MPSPEPALLEARKLTRRYGRVAVLSGVELSLAPGECLLLLGPNGAGKSTLLRILAGLARPDAGKVLVAGVAVPEARGRVGYLAHDTLLYDDLTVAENLAFAARLQGCDVGPTLERALAAADLGAHRHRLVRHLSRGLAQRTALARALLHDPALLLLDEPFTGLDAASSRALTAHLVAARAAGAAIVLVGHRAEEGWDAVTRVAVLAGGGWRHQGARPATVAELEARYREALDG